MTPSEFDAARRFLATPFGEVAYIERGEGPAALFVHGFPLNGYHWRDVLPRVSSLRRCIAPDLMGLGHTRVSSTQDLAFKAQAAMLLAFLDAAGVGEVDLVGNDSGGAIAQIMVQQAPSRVRSLTLTNCDTADNCPPVMLAATHAAAVAGRLGQMLGGALANPAAARAPSALGATFEDAERNLTDTTLATYLTPCVATPERQAMIDRYIASITTEELAGVEAALKTFDKPALVVWGDADGFFPLSYGRRLASLLPQAGDVVVLKGARLFFPEERPAEFAQALCKYWASSSVIA